MLMDPVERSEFLPLAEAAARLGISRLKLREAVAKGLLPARRDNRGRWRVDLALAPGPSGAQDLAALAEHKTAAPEALIEALFDEIEELTAERDEAVQDAAEAAVFVQRQQDALENTAKALETAQADAARLSGLLDRALDLADTLTRRDGSADPVTERALALLEETAGALEASRIEGTRLASLLSRAIALADEAAGRGEAQRAALGATAERALSLLDRSTRDLETARGDVARATALLDRAMAVSDRLERDNAEKTRALDAQARMVDRLFSISETALSAAAKMRSTERPRLFHRLFGRKSDDGQGQ
ncbi:MAG: hypothetical protein AAFR46_07565 [Pseudomonadota bacterium]